MKKKGVKKSGGKKSQKIQKKNAGQKGFKTKKRMKRCNRIRDNSGDIFSTDIFAA